MTPPRLPADRGLKPLVSVLAADREAVVDAREGRVGAHRLGKKLAESAVLRIDLAGKKADLQANKSKKIEGFEHGRLIRKKLRS